MLLKYSKIQQRSKLSASGKPRSSGKLKAVGKGKAHKKALKNAANKRIKPLVKREDVPTPVTADPCENSNDSGLGFDHHLEFASVPRITQSSFIEPDHCWTEEAKRQRLDVKLECDNANDNFTFPKTRVAAPAPSPIGQKGGKNVLANKGKRSAQLYVSQSVSLSRDGKVQLQILSQPEMQHRARYQTEGSRGAVKDRTGNSFPIVKLSGYDKPATLDVYIGTDQGRIAPHMFYQACRVSGKNSTPCVEKKVNGTVIIEIELDPSKDMIATCDCVGILKERNVDVEHRFPEESSGRSKKKSTRCRMVFRTVIMNDDNVPETLQVTSQPIICTQPPGVPEICKKSLSSCAANGGVELFILGKNFLKDTRVLFSEGEFGTDLYWEALVQPDKEFLQQSHLVCVIPPYRQEHIKEPVSVRLNVISSERSSDAHTFVYTPIGTSPMQALAQEPNVVNKSIAPNIASVPPFPGQNLLLGMPLMMPASIQMASPTFIAEESPKCKDEETISPVMLMPPPAALPARRASQPLIINDTLIELKREAESPSPSVPATSDLSTSQTPSMATLRKFVSTPNAPLPSLSVETYFSRIENKTETTPSHLSNLIQTAPPRTSEMNVYTTPLGQVPLLQNEILRTQIDFNTNRSRENEKLDALVNSTAESHLSPNRELENSTIAKEEIVLNTVLSEVAPVPMQTSPLNLNTNESCPAQIPSPTLPMCNLPQASLPITTAMLNPTEEILISQSYSGNDIRSVTDTININVNPIPSTIFNNDINTTGSITQVTNSTDLIMKAVVNDMTPQFSEGIPIQNQNPIILPSNFTSTNASINTTVGTDFIARETSPNPPFSTNILNKFVQETMKEEPRTGFTAQIFTSELKNTQANQFSQDIIFTSSSEMPRENDTFQVKNEILNENNFQASPSLTTQSLSVKLEPAEPTFVQPNVLIGTFAETKTSDQIQTIGQTVTSSIQTPPIQSRTEIPKVQNEGSVQVKKCEEGIPFPHELTQMSEHDLLSYINPSCFDQV